MKRSTLIFLALMSCPLIVSTQTGGTYQLEKSVVASGGNMSFGDAYSLESTTGQSVAGGFIQGSPYRAYSGFWTPSIAPTAASVSVGGRIMTAAGLGISHVRVTLNAPDGTIRTALTNSFGYYRFDEVRVGEMYILSVVHKRFVFSNPTQAIIVNDEITDLDVIGAEQ